MLKLKIRITDDKKVYICKDLDYKMNSNCIINWGDGVISAVGNIKDMNHGYKKAGDYEIIITNLDTDILKFKNFKQLLEVHGRLPKLNISGIVSMFEGCETLEYVDPLFFINNKFQRDATNLCKDCFKLKDIMFIIPLSDLEIIDSFLENCVSVRNLDEFADVEWGSKIRSANRAFARMEYSLAPNKDILTPMKNLITANNIFEDWKMMYECYPYFSNNLKLEYIDGAFKGCCIKTIDPNWFYYLPNTVKTDRKNIFDENVQEKLNGI